MNINWFPGHMTKSLRMIERDIKNVDAVIYVLDSRAPYSCLNPQFKRVIGNKPIVYLINKADLGVKSSIDEWVKKLAVGQNVAISVVATSSSGAQQIINAIKRLCADKLERYKNKGVNAVARAMVLGVPNCGKSTIINCLCRSAKTVTGNRAGVTRGKQWVKVNDFLEVLDTPGTLYPKLSDQTVAKRLAFIGSIRDEVADTHELAIEFLKEMKVYDASLIAERYKIEVDADENKLLERIAVSRGLLLKGGIPDEEKAAIALIDDFRKGRLGKITLEKAENYDF